MIKPTVGRVVWIRNRPGAIGYAASSQPQPEVALVVYVHSDNCINVAGWDGNGHPCISTSVMIKQDDPVLDKWMENTSGFWAEWMPYQKGQAAKTEQLESQLSKGS